MKAVVLEIRNGEAAVLCEDGQVVKIRKKTYRVGDTIEYTADMEITGHKIVSLQNMRKYGAAAAAAALVFAATGVYSYQTAFACSYVSLDVNPSIEYTLNRRNCVIGVTALNTDAESVVEKLKNDGIRKRPLAEALEKTTEILQEQGYLAGDEEQYILIGVSSDRKQNAEDLKNAAQSAFADQDVHVFVEESSIADHKNAKTLGISAGEYQKIRELKMKDAGAKDGDQNQGLEDFDIDIVTPDDVDHYGKLEVREMLEAAGEIPGTEWKEPESEAAGPKMNEENGKAGAAEEMPKPPKTEWPEGAPGDEKEKVPEHSGRTSGEREERKQETSADAPEQKAEKQGTISRDAGVKDSTIESKTEAEQKTDLIKESAPEQKEQMTAPENKGEDKEETRVGNENGSAQETIERPSDAEHPEANLSGEDGNTQADSGRGEEKMSDRENGGK